MYMYDTSEPTASNYGVLDSEWEVTDVAIVTSATPQLIAQLSTL